jgi:pyruvate/2-oxoglutarate dehydrogenase complex dihydrolipoamide dehydrogenase (E3) component
MTERIEVDICVIGAGAAGLSVAAGCSQMGARVALFEKGEMGGDCLNVGCVPSKALLAAGHAAHGIADAARFGVDAGVRTIDWGRVSAHVHGVIETIAPVDSVERYEGFGVRVIQAEAKLVGKREVEGGGVHVTAKFIVLGTGSSPAVPPIPGLAESPYLTNETIFSLESRPEHLVVLGGGPIGCELAQAHARLGCKVTVIEAAEPMGREDRDAAEVVLASMRRDGITVHARTKATAVETTTDGGIRVSVEGPDGSDSLEGSHLLVAVGRRVSFDGLGLEAAGVTIDERGHPRTGLDLRCTGNDRIFVIGDAAGGAQFTHLAGSHASVVIKRALFRLPARAETAIVPRVTYTDPELAQIGPTQAELEEQKIKHQVLRWSLEENDRAIAEDDREGFVKLLVDPKGRILGATLVGTGMGETVSMLVLAISKKMKVGDIAAIMIPYPTRSEIVKRAAGSWYTPKLFGERTRMIVRFLLRFA